MKNFLTYLFELLVVFLGVTAAFMLDRWAENNRDRKAEKQYLNSKAAHFSKRRRI